MKRFLILIFISVFIGSNLVNAQILDPVKWQFYVKAIDNEHVELKLKATLDDTWHLYGQHSEPAGGIPITFDFKKSSNYKKIGIVLEWPKPHKEYDDIMYANVQYFEKVVTFTQKIKIISDKDFVLTGFLDGQVCTTEGQCIPIHKEFEFNIKGFVANDKTPDTANATDVEDTTVATVTDTTKTDVVVTEADSAIVQTSNSSEPEIESAFDKNQSMWGLFIFAFIAGLAAILTPCVFPMIPMTVSFFMHGGDDDKKNKGKLKALFFGASIIVIYTIIGTLVSVTLGPEFANALSTHWLPNILFFLVFMVFAFSFFGMFEIVLPNWMVAKSEKQVDKGGLFAPFFMALSLVIVSFSCTGPLVGAILVESAGGSFLLPIVGMLGFALAFALPFTIFAFFPQLLNKMPQSGGWLNSVKVILGFVELALGLKFLSIVDLTYHWGLLDCEEPKYGDIHELPHGIEGYFDYEQALRCAKELNKPVFVDFTGYACVNCRKMEDKVWADPSVLKKLKNDFVVVSLYVDDKTKLPEEDWVKSEYDGRMKKTLGGKYSDFQITRFGMNAQPAYIILNPDGEVLVKKPFFYDPDARRFETYLKSGIDAFKKDKK